MYWIVFIIIISTLIFIYQHTKTNTARSIIFILIELVFIYFSAFRDGIGYDYKNYLLKVEWDNQVTFTEPIFSLLSILVEKTSISEVGIFLFYAIIINVFLLRYFKEEGNFPISILLYITIPIFFFNTFNIMRQFGSIAIFIHCLRLIKKRRYTYSIIWGIIGILNHMSFLFIIPYILLKGRNFKKGFIILGYILSIVIAIFPEIIIHLFSNLPIYSYYLTESSSNNSTLGTVLVLFNLIFISSLFFKDCAADADKEEIKNALFFFVLFMNFSIGIPILFRVALYFIPIVTVYMSNMDLSIKSAGLKISFTRPIICIIFSIIFFESIIMTNDTRMTSDRLLTPDTIMDNNYQKYKNEFLYGSRFIN